MADFVERSDFIESISEIKLTNKEITETLKYIKKEVDKLNKTTEKLKNIIIESNGKESVVDKVHRHEREIKTLVDYMNREEESKLSSLKKTNQIFWNYFIKIVTTIVTLLLILELGSNPSRFIEILKHFIK